MNENLLHFIWKMQYYSRDNLRTADGEPIFIKHAGLHNHDQGPDFTAGKVEFDDKLWVGNIELHVKTSDWEKHKHSTDSNYNNVILHVVWENDKDLQLPFPTLVLQDRVSSSLLSRYGMLRTKQQFIPCEKLIGGVREISIIAAKEKAITERLQAKADKILALVQKNKGDWAQSLWETTAANFGGTINGEALQAVAASLPITLLQKHRSQIHQLEALLFGQANFLDRNFEEAYPQMLAKEYKFLKGKYNLSSTEINPLFLRMRPVNFPTVRLAQLAMLLRQQPLLFSAILEADTLPKARALFVLAANDYWHYHYTFDNETAYNEKNIGSQMLNGIIINTVVPLLYAYGKEKNEDKYINRALQFLENCDREKNLITRGFEQLGVRNEHAYDSQALLQLKKSSCDKKLCLSCPVGNDVLGKTL